VPSKRKKKGAEDDEDEDEDEDKKEVYDPYKVKKHDTEKPSCADFFVPRLHLWRSRGHVAKVILLRRDFR